MIAGAVVVTVTDPDGQGTIPIDLGSIAILMAGLAPTLIIVRIGYRKSVDSVQQMVSAHFAEGGSQLEHDNPHVEEAIADAQKKHHKGQDA
ncbi:hypothetical protein PQX77_010305 [Marasmius sp. AFHP31]|nr:hypothetical protein PQX77_010305 [Marasmius sp. AFHP31]